MTGHPWSVLRSFRACIELSTTVPFLVSQCIAQGQFLYNKPVNPLTTRLIYLIGTLVVLLYNGLSAFQYCEVTFGTKNYTILESLYVVMVTLSTVGYGASRLVMMTLIVIAIAVLPGLISDVLNTFRKQNEGGGHVSRGAIPFILIVGSFNPEQANDILDGFLNTAKSHLSLVFLDINRPTEELKLMERNSMWGHRVQFLYGSVLNDETLKRVQARYAKAIFTISDQYATDPGKEDERNTVRLWSIHCYTVSNNVPIYTYNLSPSTAIYQKVAEEVICVREFKQYLLAMNCRCRGASTLMTNLLHQREPINTYDEPWQAQFGIDFGHIAWLLFKECQVILFAIKTYNEERDDHSILMNPCNQYVIKASDLCVYIAESPKEVKDIENLVRIYTAPFFLLTLTLECLLCMANYPRLGQRYCVSQLPSAHHALLTGRRDLITQLGQASSSSQKNTVPSQCYLLEEHAQLENVLIESTEGISNHILVCLHREVINIFKFIYNMRQVTDQQNKTLIDYIFRSSTIRYDELQDIVFICQKPPKAKIFDLISMFPRGSCRNPDDLIRAGVKRTKQVVVMSEKECLDQYERNSDSPAV
ncbi:hypothetical protein BDF14DRAFT_1733553 [Spinellus fusiger]|nr:hypothetical protein BDF14DRAFT_1733553 [Spinellus fusiger]